MRVIESENNYYAIVESLVEEYRDEIRTGGAKELATQVIGTYTIMDGEPVVYSSAEYHGENIECLDERLNPYDVFEFSENTTVPDQPFRAQNDPAAARAVEVLTNDLLENVKAL